MLAATRKLYFQDSVEMYFLAALPFLSIWICCFWAFCRILLWQFRAKFFLYLFFFLKRYWRKTIVSSIYLFPFPSNCESAWESFKYKKEDSFHKSYSFVFFNFWNNRMEVYDFLKNVTVIFFVCLSLKFFSFPLVAHQVKSNLHIIFCVHEKYIHNLQLSSCLWSAALKLLLWDKESLPCVSLIYCQRVPNYADSVVHWSLFGAHTEVMQCEL